MPMIQMLECQLIKTFVNLNCSSATPDFFTTLMFKDKDFTENIIYEKLLNDTLNTNLGYLYENIVAQILTCNGNELFYYTFFNETSRHNYEIDFLLASRNKNMSD